MNYIRLTPDNLEYEHICCAIANHRDCQVESKKAWLKDRFADGLTFLKADLRGKCFIEYLPAEKAWAPVHAPGYVYINCLWVAGKFQKQGYAGELLRACIRDAEQQHKKGLVILSSHKKRPFLSDPKFLNHAGFLPADDAPPYFELWYLPLQQNAPKPIFRPQVRQPKTPDGFVVYYTHQCPFTAKYLPLLKQKAADMGLPFTSILLQNAEQAQQAPTPFTTFSLFYQGAFVTHEILSAAKFETIAQQLVDPERNV